MNVTIAIQAREQAILFCEQEAEERANQPQTVRPYADAYPGRTDHAYWTADAAWRRDELEAFKAAMA